MKCPQCNVRILGPDRIVGFADRSITRQRQCTNGHIFTTRECPVPQAGQLLKRPVVGKLVRFDVVVGDDEPGRAR